MYKLLLNILVIFLCISCVSHKNTQENSFSKIAKRIENAETEGKSMLFLTFQWTKFRTESDSCKLLEIIETKGNPPKFENDPNWQVVYCIEKSDNSIDSIKAEHPLYVHQDVHEEDGHTHSADGHKNEAVFMFRVAYGSNEIKSIRVFSRMDKGTLIQKLTIQ